IGIHMYYQGIAFLIMVPVRFHLWPVPERTLFPVPGRGICLYSDMHHGLIIPEGFPEPIPRFRKTAHVDHAAGGATPGPGRPFFPEFTTGAYIANTSFADIIKACPKKFTCH